MESFASHQSTEPGNNVHVQGAMERCAANQATECAPDQVNFETSKTIPLKMDIHRVEVTMMESSALHQSAKSSSQEVTFDSTCSSSEIPLMMTKDLVRGIRSEEHACTSNIHSGNEMNRKENSARHQRRVPTLNGVYSGGNSPEVLSNMCTDLDDPVAGRNIKEEILECPYCSTYLTRFTDFEVHMRENHSDKMEVVHPGCDLEFNHSSLESVSTRGSSSEKVTSHSGIDSNITECSAHHHAQSTSNPVISISISPTGTLHKETELQVNRGSAVLQLNCSSLESVSAKGSSSEKVTSSYSGKDSNITESTSNPAVIYNDISPTVPLQKEMELQVNRGSAEHVFKCAYCDKVSKRLEDMELHINEKHSDEIGALHLDHGLDANRTSLKTFPVGVCSSDEIPRNASSENHIHVMQSSAASQTAELSSNQATFDVHSSMVSQSKETGCGVGKTFFKCAYYDVVSGRHAEIDSHIEQRHFHNATLITNNSSVPANKDTIPHTVNTSDEVFKCAYCLTFSKQQEEIAVHIREKHFPDTRGTCNSDNGNVGSASSSRVLNFFCAYCNKVSRSREEIESHVRETHADGPVNRVSSSFSQKCSSCWKEISCQENFMHHCCERPAEAHRDHQKPATTSFKCPTCPRVFRAKSWWLIHTEICKLRNKCPYCSNARKDFNNVYNLLEHVVFSHKNEDPSNLVPESAVTEASKDAAPGKFKCCYCPRELDTVKSLVQHWVYFHNRKMKETARDKRLEQCWICQKQLRSKKSLKRHIQSHTGERTVPCDHCDKYFVTVSELRIHLKLLSLEKNFKCEQCGKGFKRKQKLDDHLKRHRSERPYQCPHCPRSFKFGTKLKEHLRVHSGEKPYDCRYCEEEFVTSSQRSRHEMVKHDVGRTDFRCDKCSKTFKRRTGWRNHMRTHEGNVLRCDKCPFVSVYRANIDIHYFSHTGEKPYKCDRCPMRYSQPSRLKIHMRTHTGEKPYLCTQCDKAFIDSYSLKRHQRTHTGEKPYKCSYCSKSFAQGCQQQFHERTHTGERPYECAQCDKKFTRRQELNKHITTHDKVKASKSKRKESSEDSQLEKRLTRSQGRSKLVARNKGGSSEDSLVERRFTRSQGQIKPSKEPPNANQTAKRKREEPCKDSQPNKRCVRRKVLKKKLATQEKVKQKLKLREQSF